VLREDLHRSNGWRLYSHLLQKAFDLAAQIAGGLLDRFRGGEYRVTERGMCPLALAYAANGEGLLTMNTVASDNVPSGIYVLRSDARNPYWLVLTAHRADGQGPVAVEMTAGEWYYLPPVQYFVKLHLSQQQPRRPSRTDNDPTAVLPVPRGHIEWKGGQNWVVVTAHRAGTQEPVTVEMTLADWFALMPVRSAVRDGLEGWQRKRRPQILR
jgi:hypothetical protein